VVALGDAQRKAVRRETAERFKSLCTYLAVAVAAEVCHRVTEGWKGSKMLFALTTSGSHVLSVRSLSPEKSVVAQAGSNVYLVAAAPLIRLNELWTATCNKEEDRKRRDRTYNKLAHTLRCLLFVTRLRKKARKHRAADILKVFLEETHKGAQARMGMRRYVRSIMKLQKFTMDFINYRRMLWQKIYMPALLEIETRVLIANIPSLQDAFAKKLEENRFKKPSGRRQTRSTTDAVARQQSGTTTGPLRKSRTSGPSEKKALVTLEGEQEMLAILAKYRLTEEQRTDIFHQMIRAAKERWWVQYKKYKLTKASNKSEFLRWVAMAHSVGLWGSGTQKPPEPDCISYPEELKNVDIPMLHKLVSEALQPAISEASANLR